MEGNKVVMKYGVFEILPQLNMHEDARVLIHEGTFDSLGEADKQVKESFKDPTKGDGQRVVLHVYQWER